MSTVLWLYDRTSDPALLRLVELLHARRYEWIAQYAQFRYKERTSVAQIELMAKLPGLQNARVATRGVNNVQAVKTGAVWSLISGRCLTGARCRR